MGTRKDFFEICRQFGVAPSKRFASPGLQVIKDTAQMRVGRSVKTQLSK